MPITIVDNLKFCFDIVDSSPLFSFAGSCSTAIFDLELFNYSFAAYFSGLQKIAVAPAFSHKLIIQIKAITFHPP